LVHKSQQSAWEDYATNHQEWIKEGLTYRGVNVKENDPGRIPTKVYSNLEQGETAHEDNDEKPGTIQLQDNILPVWQMAGAPINASIVNMNLLSSASFEHTMVDVLIQRHGILSEIDDFSYLTGYSTALSSQEHKDNNKEIDYQQSYMLEPVFESFEDDAAIVGFVIAIFPWKTYFRDVLPPEIEMTLVIKDRCGHTKSWEICGPEVFYRQQSLNLPNMHGIIVPGETIQPSMCLDSKTTRRRITTTTTVGQEQDICRMQTRQVPHWQPTWTSLVPLMMNGFKMWITCHIAPM
jgi:hypothetical protein